MGRQVPAGTADLDRRSAEAPGAAADGIGAPDILVNVAGTNIRKQPQDYTLEEWNTVIATNLTSAFLCSRQALPELIKTQDISRQLIR